MGRFFDKLEKLDVLSIIFVIIVCLFALVVMLGWPVRFDEDNKLTDWLTAAGTIGATVAAVRIAAKSRANQLDDQNLRHRQDLFAHRTKIAWIISRLENMKKGYFNIEKEGVPREPGERIFTLRITDYINKLGEIDLTSLKAMDLNAPSELLRAQDALIRADVVATHMAVNSDNYLNDLQEALSLLKTIKEKTDKAIGNL